jgi:hypothetical protein
MSKLIVNEIEKYDAGQLTITTGTNVSIGSNLTVGGTIAGSFSVSDITTAINSISATQLSDITSVGSGSIITTIERDKLAGIAAGAEVNTVDSVNTQTGVVVLDADDIDDSATTNKFTTQSDIDKLAGIEAGAEVNTVDSVNSQTGVVVLDADDIDDTSTTNKFTTQSDIDKLAGIEAGADVTDATNVAAAGALMDGVAVLADLADVAATSPSDGQVLTYDTVNGWQPETPSGGGTIDGSGTANKVAKWSDSDTLTDSVIYDDGTNVGIGTSSPGNKLDVSGTLRSTGVLTIGNSSVANEKVIQITPSSTSAPANIQGVEAGVGGFDISLQASGGNVGIGTTSPQRTMHINVGSAATSAVRMSNSATGSGANDGFEVSIDSVGNAYVAQKEALPLIFLTNDGERLRILSGGVFLFGQTTESGVSGALPDLNSTELGRGYLILNRDDTETTKQIRFGKDGVERGSIQTTTTTSYLTSSDYRLKENVVPLDNALDRISALKPSRFNFIEEPETTVDGFLAHQVQDIVPEAISGEKDAVDANGNPEYQSIDQSKLVPLLVGAIQELRAEVESLKSQLNA